MVRTGKDAAVRATYPRTVRGGGAACKGGTATAGSIGSRAGTCSPIHAMSVATSGATPRDSGNAVGSSAGAFSMTVRRDRKRVVWGKSVSVRVDLGGLRNIKKKIQHTHRCRSYDEYPTIP